MELFLNLWLSACLVNGEVCSHNIDCFDDIKKFDISLQIDYRKIEYIPYTDEDSKDCARFEVEYFNNPDYTVTCELDSITITRLK